MLIRILFLMLLSLPFLSHGQYTRSWKLYINQKRALSAKGDSVLIVQVHKKDTSTLKFVFNPGDTAFKMKIIVMNSQGVGIDDKDIPEKGCEAYFNTQELYELSKGDDITFYTITMPADPAKAALVRVAPHPLCTLQWKE